MEKRSIQRVVVTGATGFLGGAVARRLAGEGIEVIGLGRDENAGQQLLADGVPFERVDLAESDKLSWVCQGADTVIHCAALSSPWGPIKRFAEANLLGTVELVSACQEAGVERLVHISSPGIYFCHDEGRNIDESKPAALPAASAYTLTKMWAEGVVDRAELSAVTLRPRAIFGPGDTSILPRLIRALERRRLPIIGDGENETNFTYIDNAVDAVLLAALAPHELSGRKFNITDGETLRLWDLIAEVAELLDLAPPSRRISFDRAWRAAGILEWTHRNLLFGREPMLTRYSVGLLAKTQTLSIDAARQVLGYAPKISTREGLRRFAESWKKSTS